LAVLIPSDLKSAPGIQPTDVHAGAALAAAIPDPGWIWYNSAKYSDRPRFLALSSSYGVLAVDVYDWSPIDVEAGSNGVSVAGKTLDPVGVLARRMDDIRDRTQSLQVVPRLAGFILLASFRASELETLLASRYLDRGWVMAQEELAKGQLLRFATPSDTALSPEALADVRSRLYPETQFEKPQLIHDANGARRVQIRLQLDSEQENVARSLGSGVTVVHGPSGSGKTLILAARAKLLALQHPDWKIVILCYNRVLVTYLRTLVAGHSNVAVKTVYGWLHEMAPQVNPEQDGAMRSLLSRGVGRETCDALLIDEGQDFASTWLELGADSVRADRGGLIVVSDQAQSIYRELSDRTGWSADEIRVVDLNKSYRSTEQIGRFALGAVFGTSTGASEPGRRPPVPIFQSTGPLVQLVHGSTWNAQADFIVEAIQWLVDARRVAYRDIAVLFPQNRGIVSRLMPRLEQRQIPFRWMSKDAEAKASLDLAENSVKVSTVHSCKGLEFPVVFVFGLEALDIPDDIGAADEESANRTRVAYVAMTRAQDLLFLTYTRSNPVIDRALDLREWSEPKVYPNSCARRRQPARSGPGSPRARRAQIAGPQAPW
jgi:UvrD-like helicase C-terminal domain/AAA domain